MDCTPSFVDLFGVSEFIGISASVSLFSRERELLTVEADRKNNLLYVIVVTHFVTEARMFFISRGSSSLSEHTCARPFGIALARSDASSPIEPISIR